MPGKREASDLRGASVQHMKEHALAPLDSHRLTMAQHASVDGEKLVAHLIAMRHSLGQRGFHPAFTTILELRDCRRWREEVHRHVSTAAQGGLKFFQREKHFAVVVTGVLLGFDIHRAHLPTVLAIGQVRSGADVGVIEAQSPRLRHKRNSATTVRRDERRALLRRPVDVGRKKLSVPVQLLRRIRFIANINCDALAFF
jgi:hypothetical protein